MTENPDTPNVSVLPNYDEFEIWFLTGSQDLYGEDTLARVAEQSRHVVDQMNASSKVPVRVVWRPTLKSSDGIHAEVQRANTANNVIGVITWMHTFSPAKMWIRGMGALTKPLLHFHTQANVQLPYADIDFDYMNLNQSAHGDREYGYILSRMGIERKTVVGHVSDDRALGSIGSWARAAVGWHSLQGMRVTRFGDNMRAVAVTEGDKTEAEVKLGVSVNTWAVNDLVAAVDSVSSGAVDALLAEYERLYDLVPELKSGGARRQSLRDGAAIELGLRQVLAETGAHAFTDTFEDLGDLKQLPGLAVQRLMAEGYGFGAEGDWKTAILVYALKAMAVGLPGGASLMEDYTYDLTPGDETILGAHMLEVCPSLTTTRPSLQVHPLGIGGKEDPVRLVFDADAGPGVVVAMSDMRDRFRLTANVVEVIDLPAPLPNLPVARALWKPEPNFQTSAAAWMTAGAAHHTAMTTALDIEVVRDFANIAGLELLVIDKETHLDTFQAQVRWNQAYYKLAGGM